MVTVYNTIIFTVYLLAGLVFIGAALWWFIDGVDTWWEVAIGAIMLMFGLTVTSLSGGCLIYGFNGNVHFEMKNSDGTVIVKDVSPFEYHRDGNCFRFANDKQHYCGWEVNYEYED